MLSLVTDGFDGFVAASTLGISAICCDNKDNMCVGVHVATVKNYDVNL